MVLKINNPAQPEFPELLGKYVEQFAGSMRDFAKLAGTTVGTISLCIKGKRSPPDGSLQIWAAVLGLTGAESQAFIEAGMKYKAGQHKEATPYVQHLESQLADLRKRLRELENAVEPLSILIKPLTPEFAKTVMKWAKNQDRSLLAQLLVGALSANVHLSLYANPSDLIKKIAVLIQASTTEEELLDVLRKLPALLPQLPVDTP